MKTEQYNTLVIGIIVIILLAFFALFFSRDKIFPKIERQKVPAPTPASLEKKPTPLPEAPETESAIPPRNLPRRLEF